MVYYLSTFAQQMFSVAFCLFAFTTSVCAGKYGTFEQFVQVQNILNKVDEMAHDINACDKFLSVGARGIDGLGVFSSFRPQQGLLLIITSRECNLYTPWGDFTLFKNNQLYQHIECNPQYLALLEQFCTAITIDFIKIWHVASTCECEEAFEFDCNCRFDCYCLNQRTLKRTNSRLHQSSSSIIFSDFSTTRSIYHVTQVDDMRLPKVTDFFPPAESYESIKHEWLTYEARYCEEYGVRS